MSINSWPPTVGYWVTFAPPPHQVFKNMVIMITDALVNILHIMLSCGLNYQFAIMLIIISLVSIKTKGEGSYKPSPWI